MDLAQSHPVEVALDDELGSLRRRVASAVRRTCPTWLGNQADDIVQNVMTQLLRMLRFREGERTFSAIYLEKAVYGATVDEMRRLARRRDRLAMAEVAADDRASPAPGPDRRAFSGEIARGISECLEQLGDARRLAVILHLQGCTVPETAQLMHWSEKRAENLVYRGLAELRAGLRARGLGA